MTQLFERLTLRGVQFRNRIGISPMCQYSAGHDGVATDWHHAHLGARAIGGAGLVILEATAVEARGRISLHDLGLWNDTQAEPLSRIARFLREQGAVAGIQIAHAGRKASLQRPWQGGAPLRKDEGGWEVVGPSPVAFSPGHPVPRALELSELASLRAAFRASALRAREAGFRLLELHAAHGYLLHSFLSPLSNRREDAYGGSLQNRARLLLETTRELRAVWPEERVLAVRLSAVDWVEGGLTLEDTVEVAKLLKSEGVDLIDCSSGGSSPAQVVKPAPGYQVPFAAAVKRGAGVATAAVGLISEPTQAQAIVAQGQADLVLLGRASLRNANWPIDAARALGQSVELPPQYQRAYG